MVASAPTLRHLPSTRGLPPWYPAALRLALAGLDEHALELVEDLHAREWGRRRMAVVLGRSSVLETELEELEDERERVAVRAVELVERAEREPGDEDPPDETRWALAVDGRFLRPDWLADPAVAADRLWQCSRGWGVHQRSGDYAAHPYSCGLPLCPRCAPLRMGRRATAYEPAAHLLTELGHRPVHVTLTLRHTEQPGHGPHAVVLTEREQRAGYTAERVARAAPLHGPEPIDALEEQRIRGVSIGAGHAVPGEGLLAMRERLWGTWRALRNRDRRAATWWSGSTTAYVYGHDVTGHVVRDGRRLLRWHCHLHALVWLAPGVELGAWVGQLGEHWTRLGGGPQLDVRDLSAGDEQELARGLREVLKYPCKVGELTHAQVVEYIAAEKGLKSHQPGGQLHSSSRVGRAVRHALSVGWDRWLMDLQRAGLGDEVELELERSRAVAELAGLELEQLEQLDELADGWSKVLAAWELLRCDGLEGEDPSVGALLEAVPTLTGEQLELALGLVRLRWEPPTDPALTVLIPADPPVGLDGSPLAGVELLEDLAGELRPWDHQRERWLPWRKDLDGGWWAPLQLEHLKEPPAWVSPAWELAGELRLALWDGRQVHRVTVGRVELEEQLERLPTGPPPRSGPA